MLTQTIDPFANESTGRYSRAYTPEDEEKSDLPVFLTDADEMREILAEVAERMSVAPEDRERVKSFRTRAKRADWELTNLQNFVTKEIFEGHAVAAIQGMIRDVREGEGQNNGEWMVLDYITSVGIRKGTRTKRLVLNVTLVDIKNAENLRFENGKLVTGATAADAIAALRPHAASDDRIGRALELLAQLFAEAKGVKLPESVAPVAVDTSPVLSVAEAEARADAMVASESPPIQRPDRPKVAVMIPKDKAPRRKPGPKPGVHKTE